MFWFEDSLIMLWFEDSLIIIYVIKKFSLFAHKPSNILIKYLENSFILSIRHEKITLAFAIDVTLPFIL
jgi:hypothetical protein